MSNIAIIGGTGHLGTALGKLFAKTQHQIIIGSRSADAAARTAAEIGSHVRSAANREAASGADFVFVTVPHAAQGATLTDIRGVVGDAIVIDTTVPLKPPKVMRVQLPEAGCAALEARALLGDEVRLVSAFHNVAAHRLADDGTVDCDVLVFSDDLDARKAVISLIEQAGLRAIAGGALANSAAAEALTSVLILLNKIYGADGAGLRFTGLTNAPAIP